MVPGLGEHGALSRSGRRCLALAAAALLFARPSACPAEVRGQFTVDGRIIAPKFAAAYPVRDLREPRRWAVEVMLSEGPIDADAAAAALDPHTNAINQPGLGDYVLLWVRPDDSVSMNATFSKSMTQYLDNTGGGFLGGHLLAELTANAPERVTGRVHTAAAVQTMAGTSYTIDVSFATPVHRPAAGSKLSAGGGEAGNAFAALYGALRRKDWRALRARISRQRLASLEEDYRTPEENREYVLDILRTWLPKNKMRVTGGERQPAVALLEVEGESMPGRSALYVVRMIQEDAAWRFDEVALAGLL